MHTITINISTHSSHLTYGPNLSIPLRAFLVRIVPTASVQGTPTYLFNDVVLCSCATPVVTRQAMNSQYLVTIRDISNGAAGLVIRLQVQTSSSVLSATVVVQALTVSVANAVELLIWRQKHCPSGKQHHLRRKRLYSCQHRSVLWRYIRIERRGYCRHCHRSCSYYRDCGVCCTFSGCAVQKLLPVRLFRCRARSVYCNSFFPFFSPST